MRQSPFVERHSGCLMKTARRLAAYLSGGAAVMLAWMVLSATIALAPRVAHASNGQCQWEGGPGAPTYSECSEEDCIGAGGYAQCSEPVITPYNQNEPNVDGQQFVYRMCDDTASYAADEQSWCSIEGGTYSINTGCTNISPPFNPDETASSENSALSASNQFEAPCGGAVTNDSGWGYDDSGDQFCGFPTETENNIILSDVRELTYSQPNGCGEIPTTIIIGRFRSMSCAPGDTTRTLPGGNIQCVKPASACCLKGDPVNPITGAELEQFVDYKAGGIGGLEFRRYYASNGPYRYPGNGPFVPVFSDYWHFSYQRQLTPISGNSELSAILQEEDGTVEEFDASGAEILNRSGAADRLQSNGSAGWTLTRADGDIELYNAAGNLTSLTRLNGLTITLTYNTNGAISAIADSFGHILNVGYNANGQLSTVTLPDGTSTVAYGYGPNGQLTSVTYPDTTSVQYQYQDPHNLWLLTGIEDESAQQYATYTYAPNGTAASEELGNGASQYTFAVGQVFVSQIVRVSITDPLQQARTSSYTDTNGVYRESADQSYCNDCANIASETYDSSGNPQTVTDLDGHETLYTYDDTRNLELSRTEGLSGGQSTSATRTITTQWHPTLRLPTLVSVYAGASATGTPLLTTAYSYDSYGNVLTKTITDGSTGATRTWTYTYFNGGEYGQVESADGPRTDVADVTTYTYYDCTSGGECGQAQTITDALGHVTTFNSYDANGNPLQITDANGTVTTLTYDKRQRLTGSTTGAETTQFAYYPTGLLQRVTMPDGSALVYVYDAAHRLTEMDDSLGDRLVYTLDAAGDHQATQIHDPSGTLVRASSTLYNDLGQLWQHLTSAATTATSTAYSYDAEGDLTSTAAPLGRTIEETYDSLNRVATVTDPANGLTTYSYDANDDITGVSDPRGLSTTYTYDGFGEVKDLQSPDSGTTQFTYDDGGNLLTSVDGRNANATYSYDALNRVTRLAYSDQTVSFGYDQGSNAIGHLSSISDGSGQTAFSYDALGRVTQKMETVNGTNLNVSYSYQNGDLSSLTTPSGQALTYTYNAAGEISSISLNGSLLLSSIHYSPFGPVTGWTWGNGTQTVRDYDLDGQITEIDSAGTSTYTYNDDGTISSRSDDVEADYSVSSGTTTLTVSPTSNQIATASGALVRTYSYDGAGNTLGTGSASFTYNQASRLSSITESGATVTFGINALGQRVSKTSTSGTILFAYDEEGHLIGEYGSTGSLIEETVWLANTPVASLRPDPSGGVDVYYVHTDQVNSPRRVTRASDNVLVWRWSSDPYGNGFVDEDPEGIGQLFVYNLRLPGQYYDSETGFVYNYQRDYDSLLGRYIESDPIGLAGGSYSTYAYVDGNPVNGSDSLGEAGAGATTAAPDWSLPEWLEVPAVRTLGIIGIMLSLSGDTPQQAQSTATSVTEYCSKCRATATRSEAMAAAYAFAGIPAVGADPIPWTNFNPPGGNAFKKGPVWADFRRLYNAQNYGYSYNGGSVEEHPFGHPGLSGGENHDCPHFVAVNGAGKKMEFPYRPGSP